MNTFLNLFLSGTVVSLPSIIAASGILINNYKASLRQKTDRNIRIKVELLERIYTNFDNISDDYIIIMSSLKTRLYEIKEEILEYGTDNKLQSYVLELNELAKKALFLAVHKRQILDIYRIKVDADELAKYIHEVTKKIAVYADSIAYITKLFVVKYYETGDYDLSKQAVIQELDDELEMSKIYNQNKEAWDVYLQYNGNPQRELVKDYNTVLTTFNDIEKRKIGTSISLIINSYLKDLEKYGTELFDDYEKQIVTAIKKIIK